MDKFALHSSNARGRGEYGAEPWMLTRKLVLVLWLAFACQCALAQAMYRLKPLGYVGGCTGPSPFAIGLNGAGQVAGDACNAHGDTHAFLWKNDGTPMVDLGPDEVGPVSYSQAYALSASGLVTGYAYDSTGEFGFLSSGNGTPMTKIYNGWGGADVLPTSINDLGQLTGSANPGVGSAEHAFLWKNDGSPMLDLGTFGGANSYGYAINASGQVAGTSYLPGNTAHHAFLWKNDGSPMLDLGTLGSDYSVALGINASGQVAGFSHVIQNHVLKRHVFFWRNDATPMQDLGTLGGKESSFAALNDSGQIAGNSFTYRMTHQHAFVWMNDGTPMKNLGTFGGTSSQANDINASGQVAGWAYLAGDAVFHAFLWRNDGTKIQDLNKLIDPTDPLKPYVTLTSGDFINDRSDIVADGIDSRTGAYDLYLLQGTILTLAPRSLAFRSQPIHTTSAAKSVTVTNTSPKAAAITSIALTGISSGQFGSTNNCGKSLSGHAFCTIKVTFKPTTKGAKSAFMTVNGGGGGLRSVSLTGTGT